MAGKGEKTWDETKVIEKRMHLLPPLSLSRSLSLSLSLSLFPLSVSQWLASSEYCMMSCTTDISSVLFSLNVCFDVSSVAVLLCCFFLILVSIRKIGSCQIVAQIVKKIVSIVSFLLELERARFSSFEPPQVLKANLELDNVGLSILNLTWFASRHNW